MRLRKAKGRKETCSKCGKRKEESRKKYAYCKACHTENMRKTRPLHSQLNPLAKKKANARAYAKVYINRGKLKKEPCEICGDENSEMHHENYDKPLEVKWLCRKHHLEKHTKFHIEENLEIIKNQNVFNAEKYFDK